MPVELDVIGKKILIRSYLEYVSPPRDEWHDTFFTWQAGTRPSQLA